VGAWIEDLVRSVATNTLPILRTLPLKNNHSFKVLKVQKVQIQSYFEVPNRRVSHFFGRKDIINKIDKALSVGPGPHIAVLRGLGGQGKSQLAMEYCHRKKDSSSPDIFWIDASSESSVISTFVSISGLISTVTDQLHNNDARIAFVNRKFASWPTELLLVFDNYDNPHEFPNIQDYFPSNKIVSILVTGRHADIGTLVLGQDDNFIELSGLENTAAVDLLEHHSQVKETNSKYGEEIVRRLGYHPLAITQAGTYIRKGGIPLGEFMDVYKQEKEEILKNTPQLSQYRRKLGDTENETSLNVFTTWQLSFQQLLSHTSDDDVAVKLLRLLAFFDNKDISEWLFIEFHRNSVIDETAKLLEWVDRFTDSQKHWSNRLFKKNLVLLHDFCLLQSVTQDADEYSHASMHPLIKDWIQLQMGKSACQQYTIMAAKILGDILWTYYENEHFRLPLFKKQYLVLHLIAQKDNNDEDVGIKYEELPRDLLIEYTINKSKFAEFFRLQGLYYIAEPLEVQVMETRKKVLGEEHTDTLTSINNLAFTYWDQGRWDEAEVLEVKVLEIRNRLLGAENEHTLIGMNNLASTYWIQGRYEEAESLWADVLEKRKRARGVEHLDTLASMRNLALAYSGQGRLEEAESLGAQVLEKSKRVLGAEHPDTLTSMNNLASTYSRQGRLEEAELLEAQALEKRKRVLGAEHPRTLMSMNNLALTYWRQGRYEEAESLGAQALEKRKRVLGAEHPETLTSMNNLAFTWKRQGRYLEALKLLEECMQLQIRVLGSNHRDTLDSRAVLLEWQAENLEISSLVEESPKGVREEEQRQEKLEVVT
jgi:tetratricopeptide (TPR) repeat protein